MVAIPWLVRAALLRRLLRFSRRGILAEMKSLKTGDEPAAACANVKSVLAQIEASIEAALTATGQTALPSQDEIDAERLEYDQKRNASTPGVPVSTRRARNSGRWSKPLSPSTR
jgi:hypothetical protein